MQPGGKGKRARTKRRARGGGEKWEQQTFHCLSSKKKLVVLPARDDGKSKYSGRGKEVCRSKLILNHSHQTPFIKIKMGIGNYNWGEGKTDLVTGGGGERRRNTTEGRGGKRRRDTRGIKTNIGGIGFKTEDG